MPRLKSKFKLFLGSGLLVILLFPIQLIVAPRMTLKVVDMNGNSVPNVIVRQTWQHYSFESSSNEEKVQADEQGNVTFRERIKRIPFLLVILGKIVEKININPHASSSPVSYFYVEDYDTRTVRYKPSEEIPNQIVAIRKIEYEK